MPDMTFETTFWIAAALMLALAAAAVLWALLRKSPADDAEAARELSREALADQLDVLKDEKAAGLVTESIYEASVADVERRALDELTRDEARVHRNAPFGKAFAAVLVVVMAASALALYMKLGSPSLINFVSEPKKGIMQADGTLGSTEGFYDEAALAAYLKDNGEDERAWVLYARLLVRKEAWSEAAASYKKALDLNGLVAKDANVLVEYAAALISQQTPQTYEASLPVLEKAIDIDAKLLTARELYAISCLELGRWGKARENLEYLLSRISMDDPVYERLSQAASYAAHREKQAGEARNEGEQPSK